jgi:hypothetical protein
MGGEYCKQIFMSSRTAAFSEERIGEKRGGWGERLVGMGNSSSKPIGDNKKLNDY